MTHELGRHWEQPPREKILLDGTHALMTRATFEALMNYTTTCPSGVYEGKMWRAQHHDGFQNGVLVLRPDKPWKLRWYEKHPTNQNACRIQQRDILIADDGPRS